MQAASVNPGRPLKNSGLDTLCGACFIPTTAWTEVELRGSDKVTGSLFSCQRILPPTFLLSSFAAL